mmetsp:Transcript_17933/g.26542  ORF Transcript_17933/g.26542 Transcript_17933/m.26542 type:complete len:456 (+) Transcript_17933:158-1525(+)
MEGSYSTFLVLFTFLHLWKLSLCSTEEDIFTVSWNAPFLSSSSGYGSEATSFLVGLNATLSTQEAKIAAGLAHGDAIDNDYVSTLKPELSELFQTAHIEQMKIIEGSSKSKNVIIICHSEPGAWSVPRPLYDSGMPCPPHGKRNNQIVVGRTMFETDRLPSGWNERLNAVDEIWVPSLHHKRIFLDGGVTKPIAVVGQGVDVEVWNPDNVEPLNFKTDIDKKDKCSCDDYKFLSVFKWEARKAPEILVPAFYRAFPQGKGACLIILTSLYHQDASEVLKQLREFCKASEECDNVKDPQGVVILNRVSPDYLLRLYKTADAFVLPSRGEGWGRPYMEAMAMGLPVIATNWSGPTEFVKDDHGYLLPINGLVDANLDSFPNHMWADPNAQELEYLFRHIKENPKEAKNKGQRSREYVVKEWSNLAVAKQVSHHLRRLAKTTKQKKPKHISKVDGKEL